MIIRPNCKRCNLPLDLFLDEDGVIRWTCSISKKNDGKLSRPCYNNDEFKTIWNNLSGDDVVRLEKEIDTPVYNFIGEKHES